MPAARPRRGPGERAIVLTLARRYVDKADPRAEWKAPREIDLVALPPSPALASQPWRALPQSTTRAQRWPKGRMPSSNGVPTMARPASRRWKHPPSHRTRGLEVRESVALGRMTLALTLALCTRPVCIRSAHREVLGWVTGVVAGALDANVMSSTFYFECA